MKKIILLFALGIYCVSVMAQKVTLRNSVSIDLPKGAERITDQQALAHARNKYKDTLVTNVYKGQRSDYICKIGDIILSLNASDRHSLAKIGPSYLKFKNTLDAQAHGSDVPYPSSIKRIKNDTVVTSYIRLGKVNYCYFFYFHGKSNAARKVVGELEFDPTDSVKAKNVLDQILKNITFLD